MIIQHGSHVIPIWTPSWHFYTGLVLIQGLQSPILKPLSKAYRHSSQEKKGQAQQKTWVITTPTPPPPSWKGNSVLPAANLPNRIPREVPARKDIPGQVEPAAHIRGDAHIAATAGTRRADAAQRTVGAGSAVGEAGAGSLAVDAEALPAADGGAHAAAAGTAGPEGLAGLASAGVEGAGAVGAGSGGALRGGGGKLVSFGVLSSFFGNGT